MLKQRLLTALVLIPLVLFALFKLDTGVVSVLFSLVAGLAAIEWLRFTGVSSKPFLMGIITFMILMSYLLIEHATLPFIVSSNFAIWGIASCFVIAFSHRVIPPSLIALLQSKLFNVIVMLLIMVSFILSAFILHGFSQQGPYLVLYVMMTVWLADTGGYFAGKRFGKRKLAPAISPNKTWEGVLGGLVFSWVWAVIFASLMRDYALAHWQWFLLTSAIVLVSIVGDLFESVFKRQFGVKDSGNLLPGHGGMLDRIDSLLAAMPVFTAGWLLLGV
jgi:phosphatidate cytidylyltransferase